ncbi:MAG TPA: hypothetical protein VMW27_13460 [Thermoanaerobaculia bacterium]|nr:hypothetical protein [Thermoanaerobaculia bacterium]
MSSETPAVQTVRIAKSQGNEDPNSQGPIGEDPGPPYDPPPPDPNPNG